MPHSALCLDIGGPMDWYFVVKPRNELANEFVEWVEQPHNQDKMDVHFPDEELTKELDGDDE